MADKNGSRGGVKGSRENGNDADDFIADNASMELRPRRNEIKELNLRGDVQLKSKMEKTGESRTLETSALLVQFAERNKGEGSALERAETLARGTLEWTDPGPQLARSASPAEAGPARTKLTADKLGSRSARTEEQIN